MRKSESYYFPVEHISALSVDACNRANKEFRMQIAYGCAAYAAEVDKTLEDTYNRADKIMYKDKEEKKAKKGSHR